MNNAMRAMRKPRLAARVTTGFTLIELMIVVAIIAILAMIAYPSYVAYITKSNRKAAEACLSTFANYMERYYTTNLRYDQDTAATPVANALPTGSTDCASTQQTGRNYSYSFVSGSLTASAYTVQATPVNVQLTRDTLCGTLTLNQAGTRTSSGSGPLSQCW
jgi:type IV pilus assembly protein PilE